MTIDHLLPIAIVMAGATAVQGAVGFGAGLVAIPLLVWLGVALPCAVGVSSAMVIVQTGLNCWQYRADLPWRSVVPFFLLRAALMPVGVGILYLLADFDQAHAQQIIGLVLLMILAAQAWIRVPPRSQIHGGWTALAGSLSGLLAGSIGMGGPPIVLWVMAHDWLPSRQRAFLWLNFLLLIPINLPLLCATFGRPLVTALLFGLALTPVALAGAWLGGKLGHLLSRERLRLSMSLVLLALAIFSIIRPVLDRREKVRHIDRKESATIAVLDQEQPRRSFDNIRCVEIP